MTCDLRPMEARPAPCTPNNLLVSCSFKQRPGTIGSMKSSTALLSHPAAPVSVPSSLQIFNTFLAADDAVSASADTVEPAPVQPLFELRREDLVGLNPQQRLFLQQVAQRRSVFLTGAAGTGKTQVLLRLQSIVRQQGVAHAFTASTGRAALALSGETIHKFSLLGAAQGSVDTCVSKAVRLTMSKPDVLQQFLDLQLLIIDEVSMLPASFLRKVDTLLTRLRAADTPHDSVPFGGVTVVLTGDFLQLPPVGADTSTVSLFQSLDFARWVPWTVYLHRNMRQQHAAFALALQELRFAHRHVSAETMALLQSRVIPSSVVTASIRGGADLLPSCVYVYPYLRDVRRVNHERMMALQADDPERRQVVSLAPSVRVAVRYQQREIWREDDITANAPQLQRLLALLREQPPSTATVSLADLTKNDAELETLRFVKGTSTWPAFPATWGLWHSLLTCLRSIRLHSEDCTLVQGMRVMLTCNLSTTDGLVHGALGTLLGFTQHFPKRQAHWPDLLVQCASNVTEAVQQCQKAAEAAEVAPSGIGLPVVRFQNGLTLVIPHMVQTESLALRAAVPRSVSQQLRDAAIFPVKLRPAERACIKLSYAPIQPAEALTIHAVQGLTVDNMVVKLDRVFTTSQAYVAVSRPRTLEGLFIEESVHAAHFTTSLEATQVYRILDELCEAEPLRVRSIPVNTAELIRQARVAATDDAAASCRAPGTRKRSMPSAEAEKRRRFG